MADERTDHWDRVYTSRDDTEVSWFEPRPATSLELIRAAGLPAGARVIDVGGGTSRLVEALLEEGFHPTVLDVSAAALERARRRLGPDAGRVSWVRGDVTRCDPGGPFALWHDRAVFHFLTDPGDRHAYAGRLRDAVPAGGWVVMATFGPEGPTRCSGLDVCRYSAAELVAALGPGLELEEERLVEHVTPGGSAQQFLYTRLRRRN